MLKRFCIIPGMIVPLLLFGSRGKVGLQKEAGGLQRGPEAGKQVESFHPPDSSYSLIGAVPEGSYLGKGLLREPLGVSIDPRGVVYVADAMAGKIFRFPDRSEGIEFEPPSGLGSIYPIDLAGSGTFVYVLEYSSSRILRYDYRGAYLDVLISFKEYEKLKPVSMTFEPDGRFLVTDIENHSVAVFNPLLDIELELGDYGWSEGFFDRPMKSVILPDGRIGVADMGNRRVQIFSPSGAYLDTLRTTNSALCSPRSMCCDSYGNIFVADTQCGSIRVFSEKGVELLVIDSYLDESISPSDLSAGLDDYLYVSDLKSRSVIIYKLVYPDIRR